MSAPSSAGGFRTTLLALRAGADAARARIHFYRPPVRVVEMDAEKAIIPVVLRRTAEGLTAKRRARRAPSAAQRLPGSAAAARERSDSPGLRSGPCPGLAPDLRTIHIPRRCRSLRERARRRRRASLEKLGATPHLGCLSSRFPRGGAPLSSSSRPTR